MNASLWWVDTAKVHVLAEDEFTRALLVGVWDDVRLRVDVAGGGDAVGTLVEEARRSGANNVFGVVDRDFHVSAGWRGARVYRFERHEAENYLLDDDALAARARVAPHEIAAETRRYVEACCGYMAARDTLWKLQASVTEGFPTAPRTPTPEHPFALEEAIASMQTSPFLRGLQSRLRADWTDVALERTVTDAFTRFVRESADDTWRRTFSGKEILRHLRGHFARLSGTRGASASDNDADLATRVARYWRRRGAVPRELDHLHVAILHRVGIAGPVTTTPR